MAKLATRPAYRRRILQAIGNQSPEELGQLVIDMMENIDRTYEEAGIDDSGTEEDYFEYSRGYNAGADRDMAEAYMRLEDEYRRRFGGVDNVDGRRDRGRRDLRMDTAMAPRESLPVSQPVADDITVGINPDTGVEETTLGHGTEEIVSESDIFEEDER